MQKNDLIEQLYLSQALEHTPLKIIPQNLSFRPDLLYSLAKAFAPIISSLHYDFLYPTDIFSIPLATHLSLSYNIPLFIRPSTDSFMSPGQTALLLDTSSLAFHACSEELIHHGIFISDVLILLGNTPKKTEITQKAKITIHNLWDIKTLENDLNTILQQNSYSKIH